MKSQSVFAIIPTLLVALLSCFAMSLPARAAPRAQHVFIISFDGGKPAVMQRSAMPSVFEMVQQGAATWNAQTIFPSITLPSHTSMLTGVRMEEHRISWNDWEPKRGLVTVPTICTRGERE